MMPRSSEISSPPVSTAMSWSMALRLSPKPGALAAEIFRTPRMRFTMRVASAVPEDLSEARMRVSDRDRHIRPIQFARVRVNTIY